MWIWQRKELWAGCSMEEFNRLRRVLAQNHIRYDYHMNNQHRLNFDRNANLLGGIDRDPRFDTIYYLYVRGEDLDRARKIIGGPG